MGRRAALARKARPGRSALVRKHGGTIPSPSALCLCHHEGGDTAILARMFDWILSVIESGGYLGIFFLMVLENLFPPIPSELVIPLAGFAAASGSLNIIAVVVVATLGAVVGALPWYYLARLFGIDRVKRLSARYGRALTLTGQDIDDAQAWFARYGTLAVLVGRLVPTVRTLISVPAGIARMPLPSFLLFTGVGSLVWTLALASLGYVLRSEYALVEDYLNPVSNGIVACIVLYYIYRVLTFRSR